MIAYRDVVRTTSASALLRELSALAGAGRATDFLVVLGELEQGVADARHPDRDDCTEADTALRDVATTAAGVPVDASVSRRLGALLGRLREATAGAPGPLRVHVPEGYAHYGLDPDAYRAAAEAYRRDVGARATAAVVVGVRSIGTSLSAVVAATLGARSSITVRPRGTSGAREVRATARVGRLLRDGIRAGGDVLVVDEGPGATGETFECVVRWVRGEGIPRSRIVLFPSHDGTMPLGPESRRAWFRASRRYPPPLADGRAARIAALRGWCAPEDLSAGRWRRVVEGAAEAPARPHFERLKFRVRDGAGRTRLLRYAGVGGHLDRLVEGGRALAAALAEVRGAPRFEPPEPEALGFASTPWIEGPIAGRTLAGDRGLRAVLAAYVGARAGRFRAGEAVDAGFWMRVLRENGAEAGTVPSSLLERAAARLEALPVREGVLPDGRLQPWEWIRAGETWAKVDALDHADGFRLPGPADAAWDLAGAAVEATLTGAEVSDLVRHAAGRSGESRGELAEAVAAYRPVYAAAAFGDAALAAREAPDDRDRALLRALARFYEVRLGEEVVRSASSAPLRPGLRRRPGRGAAAEDRGASAESAPDPGRVGDPDGEPRSRASAARTSSTRA